MDLIQYIQSTGAAIAAWKASDLLREIYGDALKPGVAQVGKALGGVLGLGNTILFPLHLVNDRAKAALEANMERYRERLANEPLDKIVEVPPEIGVPIAEKLAYVSDPSLADMFVELLAKASLADDVGAAHPSFVNLVNSLSPDEASFLRNWVGEGSSVSVVPLASQPGDSFSRIVGQPVYPNAVKAGVAFPHYLGVYLSNLEGLGVLELSFEKQNLSPGAYDQLEATARAELEPTLGDQRVLSFKRGLTQVTPYGRMFLHAAGVRARS